jgi:hypothetical protein
VETQAGSRVFPTPPLPGWHHLLLAGAGRTEPIRMEETYTATTMKLARKAVYGIHNFGFFLLTYMYLRFYSRNRHFMKEHMKIKT